MQRASIGVFVFVVAFGMISPAWAVDAADGWISLFNGKNMDGWRQISPQQNRWVVEDGVMINKNKGCDIAAGPDLTDYQVHVEWKLPKRSNSGIYLRGHYEIQIDDCYGDQPGKGCGGGIYGQHAPRVNACLPAGRWQVFDATIIGDRVWVIHNGVHVVTNGKLTGKSGAAMPGKHGDAGPLKIQGDHGPIALRNILVRPLAKGEKLVLFPAKTGFTPLFDGKSLEGWTVTACGHGTGGKWEVIDGAIAGDQDKPGNGGIVLSSQTFGDFEITLDVMPDWGCDSGVFLRSNSKGQCYQVLVDYYKGGNVGGIYGEGTGGFKARNYDFGADRVPLPRSDAEFSFPKGKENSLYFADGWNHIRARIVGNPPTIDVWLNGRHITHFVDTKKRLPDAGHIGLQVHGGKGWRMGNKTRFKQIEIRPLN